MDWNEALKAARDEHRTLLQKRDELDAARAEIDFEVEKVDQRAVQLEQTINSLAELTGANKMPQRLAPIDVNNLKLANACRAVLGSSNNFWTPITVRDHLMSLQYDLRPYSNPLASIHAVLKRLIDSGEAVRTAGPDGKAMYRWKAAALPLLTRNPPTRAEAALAAEKRDLAELPKLVRRTRGNAFQEFAESVKRAPQTAVQNLIDEVSKKKD